MKSARGDCLCLLRAASKRPCGSPTNFFPRCISPTKKKITNNRTQYRHWRHRLKNVTRLRNPLPEYIQLRLHSRLNCIILPTAALFMCVQFCNKRSRCCLPTNSKPGHAFVSLHACPIAKQARFARGCGLALRSQQKKENAI